VSWIFLAPKHDHTAERRQEFKALVSHFAGGGFKNDIDSLALRRLSNLMCPLLGRVIDCHVSSQTCDEIQLIFRARERNNSPDAHDFCYLHQVKSDTAGCRLDEKAFCGLRLRRQLEKRICQQALNWNGDRLAEGDTLGNRDRDSCIGGRIFGITATRNERRYPVANVQILYRSPSSTTTPAASKPITNGGSFGMRYRPFVSSNSAKLTPAA
jgi:hypothetical protein